MKKYLIPLAVGSMLFLGGCAVGSGRYNPKTGEISFFYGRAGNQKVEDTTVTGPGGIGVTIGKQESDGTLPLLEKIVDKIPD